jgi:hypothetical protein
MPEVSGNTPSPSPPSTDHTNLRQSPFRYLHFI